MRPLSKLSLLILTVLSASVFLTSCGRDNFDKIPRTGFTKTYNHDKDNRTPFLSYWEDGDSKEWNSRIAGTKGKKQLLYVKDVDISHMDKKAQKEDNQKDLNALRDYFKKDLVSHLKAEEKKNSNFVLTDLPTNQCYTLEVAITSITPTNIKANVISMGLGSAQRGSDLLVKGITKKGHIAIAAKLWDDKGNLIAEMADYEEDHPSILGIDVKNFKKYAHHKQNLDVWCDEFTEVLTAPTDKKIKKKKFFLNPF